MIPRVGIIGFGAIAQDLVTILCAEGPAPRLAILVRSGRESTTREVLSSKGLPDGALITSNLDEWLDPVPDVVAECAGHGAVDSYGQAVLNAGADLVIASVGALADAALFDRLRNAAENSGGQVIIPSGAIGGLDVLSVARLSGLVSVDYTGRKPPLAWAGTPAEDTYDLSALDAPTVIFKGTAREAATSYPKNANVAATLALAGLGMDHTGAMLIADPTITENVHEFRVISNAVEATLRLVGKPSPRNPKTSQTTALSIARAVQNRWSAIVI
ncbi:aspartate dehydrogenase [Paracoccaceae bacterium]|nr:aspartate dehydrogenase [Paracoccaceae bacterium]